MLTSRSGIKSGYQARCLQLWRSKNIRVKICTFDISNIDQACKLITQAQHDLEGPIGGLFHLAMVLRDCLFENQTSKNFFESAEAKYYGTKNLDVATRQLCDENLKW